MFVVVFVLMAGLVLAGSAAVREPPLDRVGDGRGDVVARAGHPRHATTTAAPLVEEALPMPQAGVALTMTPGGPSVWSAAGAPPSGAKGATPVLTASAPELQRGMRALSSPAWPTSVISLDRGRWSELLVFTNTIRRHGGFWGFTLLGTSVTRFVVPDGGAPRRLETVALSADVDALAHVTWGTASIADDGWIVV